MAVKRVADRNLAPANAHGLRQANDLLHQTCHDPSQGTLLHVGTLRAFAQMPLALAGNRDEAWRSPSRR
jgi:hypothetical protein